MHPKRITYYKRCLIYFLGQGVSEHGWLMEFVKAHCMVDQEKSCNCPVSTCNDEDTTEDKLDGERGCVASIPSWLRPKTPIYPLPQNIPGNISIFLEDATISSLKSIALKKDRAECLEGLRRYQNELACLPLEEASVSVEQALKDIVRERVILNGLEFVGEGEVLLQTLSMLCERLASSPVAQELGLGAKELYEGVLCKSSRTTSGSDSYFTLQTLLGTPQLLLKPRLDCRPSLHINLCLSHNNLESEVIATNPYALYDVDEIENFAEADGCGAPPLWLAIDTEVVDKTDYKTKRNIRYLRVTVPPTAGSKDRVSCSPTRSCLGGAP